MKNLESMTEMQKKAKSEMEKFGLDYTSVQSAIAHMYGISPAEIQIIGFNVGEDSILYRHGANDSAAIPISEVTSKDVK